MVFFVLINSNAWFCYSCYTAPIKATYYHYMCCSCYYCYCSNFLVLEPYQLIAITIATILIM